VIVRPAFCRAELCAGAEADHRRSAERLNALQACDFSPS
jgi:hypothetical protein